MKRTLSFILTAMMILSSVIFTTVSAEGDFSEENVAWQWNVSSGDCLCINSFGDVPVQYDFWVRFDSGFDGYPGIIPQTENSLCIDPVGSKIGIGSYLADFTFEVDRLYHVVFSDQGVAGTVITVDDEFAGLIGTNCTANILCTMSGVTIDDFRVIGNGATYIDEDFQDGVFDGAGEGTDGSAVVDPMAPDHEHRWREAIVVKEATDDEPGVLRYTCSLCNRYRYENYTVVTDKDEILGMLFTDGRGMISNEDFQHAAGSLVLLRLPQITYENGSVFVKFDDPYSAVVVPLEEGEEATYENAAELLGLNPKYFRIGTVTTETNDGQRCAHISIAFNNTASYTFSTNNKLSQIDRLFLFATAAYSTRNCYPDNAGVLRGWMYYQQYGYCDTDDYKRDANLDGVVNLRDVLYMKRYLAGSVSIVNLAATDINGDGTFNIKDYSALKSIIAGAE